MEENTNNEQIMNLDEEQLQAVTGGFGYVMPQGNAVFHHQNAQSWINLADREHRNGNHDLANEFAGRASQHLDALTAFTNSPRSPK